MVEIRKIITMREVVLSELGVAASRPSRPVVRAVGMAVIRNPFAGKYVEDLRELYEAGAALGERLMPELVKMLDGPAVSYGKGAIVGTDGIREAKRSIADGEMRATVAEFPYEEGKLGVEVALRILAGQPIPPWVVSPQAVITVENVKDFPNPPAQK